MFASVRRSFVVVLLFVFVVAASAQSNQPGYALQFDGVDDVATVTTNSSDFNTLPLTVMAWVNTTQSGNSGLINKYRSGSFNGWQVFIVSGQLRAWYFGSNTRYIWDGGNGLNAGNINDGRWHHVAFTVDNADGRLYVDGVLKDSRVWTGTSLKCTNTEPVRFGDYPGTGSSQFYPGKLDEVSIWQSALSQAAIQSYMNQSLVGNESGLLGYWRFDEGTGTTANDTATSVSGNNVAVLSGGPTWIASMAGIGSPAVTMYGATNFTYMEADLPARVEPRARQSVTWFQWGTSVDLTGRPQVGLQTNAAADVLLLTNHITGITPGQFIFYRAVATNSSGITFGATTNFYIPATPPAATTADASSVTATNAVLNGTVHSHGLQTTVSFHFGTTTNYGSSFFVASIPPSESATNLQYLASGLAPGQTYHFRVSGVNNAGSTVGSDLQFTTPAILPSVVLSNITFNSTLGYLSGRASAGGAATAVRFEYGDTVALGQATAWQSIGSGNSFIAASTTVSNLVIGQTIFYRLVATNSVGQTNSSTLQAMIPAFVAQQSNAGIYQYGTAAWADYDNDGNLDLVIGGSGNIRLLRNLGGVLTVVSNTGLPSINSGTVAWGDYNRDSRVDLLIATAGTLSIYRNTAFGFVAVPLATPASAAAAVWGDFDNDGALDVAVVGPSMGKIFTQQTDGTFIDSGVSLPTLGGNGSSGAGLAAADFNQDGALDLIVTGAGQTVVLLNDGHGHFTAAQATGLPGFSSARVAVADFDADGAVDVVLSGQVSSTQVCRVYRNTTVSGTISFTEIPTSLFGAADAALSVADLNQDGWPDIALAGASPGAWDAGVFLNAGGTNFVRTATTLPHMFSATLAAGDVQNDGRLDLFAMGSDIAFTPSPVNVPVGDLFTNNFAASNTRPTRPAQLTNVVNGSTVTLSWSPGQDAETPTAGLTYDLRIGHNPGFPDVSAPPADQAGKRKIAAAGPLKAQTFIFQPKQAGWFYWSVQSVDASFAGSQFSATNSFYLAFAPSIVSIAAPTSFQPTTLTAKVNPNGADTVGYFEWGTTTNYGQQTTTFTLGLSIIPFPIANSIGNQPIGNTFHFRLVLSNAVGVTISPDVVYTVPHFEVVPVNGPQTTIGDSVRWADLNGDGILDVIAGNRAFRFQPNATVNYGWWYPWPQSVSAELQSASQVSVSDVLRSGNLSFAVGGTTSSVYQIQYWAATNASDVLTPLPALGYTGLAPGAAFGDYNNDGRPDLMVGGYDFGPSGSYDTTQLLRQQADGSFVLAFTNGLPGAAQGAVWGDCNNDGWLDFAGSRAHPGIAINQNGTNFTTTFIPVQYGDTTAGWADYDNDGWLDLIIASRIYHNVGGTFVPLDAPNVPTPYIYGDAKWGDLNGDGFVDVILAQSDSNSSLILKYWRNTGTGSFVEENLIVPPGARAGSFDVGDFEGNGTLDIVVAPAFRDFYVLRNLFTAVNQAPTAPTNLTATLSQDGSVAIAWNAATDAETTTAGLSYNLRVVHPDGSLLFAPESTATGRLRVPQPGRWQVTNVNVTLPLTKGVYRAEVQAVDGSFNGSPFTSLKFGVLTNPIATTIGANNAALTNAFLFGQVTPMGAAGEAWFEWGYTTNYGSATARYSFADNFETYGFTNVITELPPGAEIHFRTVGSNSFGVSYGSDMSFVVPRMVSHSLNAYVWSSAFCAADFNNDGILDIAAGLDFTLNVFYGDGHGNYTNTVIDPLAPYGPMTAVDLDGDGFIDLVASSDSDFGPVTRAWRNNGDSTFSPYPISITAGQMWGGIAAADFNNDNRIDFVVTSQTAIEIWKGKTDGTFEQVTTIGSSDKLLNGFALADYDRDGDIDIFNAGGQGLWKNQGSLQFTNVALTGYAAADVQTAVWFDFDADGWPDLAVGDDYGLHLWHNDNGALTPFATSGVPALATVSLAAGDFDADGANDLLVAAYSADYSVFNVFVLSWKNNSWQTLSLPGAEVDQYSHLLPGDFNNDGRLDIAMASLNGATAKVIDNRFVITTNQPPAAPTGLSATVGTNGAMVFSWVTPTNDLTPVATMHYAIRVGTAPGRGDIVNAYALTNGSRQVLNLPMLATNVWSPRGIPYGHYYWSVQAIDAGFGASSFAPEAEFFFDPFRPRLLSVTRANSNVNVTFTGAPSTSYGVEGASSLQTPMTWQSFGARLSDSNGFFGVSDTNVANRFYRFTYPAAP